MKHTLYNKDSINTLIYCIIILLYIVLVYYYEIYRTIHVLNIKKKKCPKTSDRERT